MGFPTFAELEISIIKFKMADVQFYHKMAGLVNQKITSVKEF